MSTTARWSIVCVLMLATAAFLAQRSRAEPVPIREALDTCPVMIGDWRGQTAAPFDPRTLTVLGVDEYLNRVYRAPDGLPLGLYVGYYGSQRQGDTMHSPLNCLPGAGWTPVSFARIDVAVPAASTTIHVNRYTVEKGLERQVVLYWYQSHGRVVASEYWGKIYLVLDAIRTNRTDGALVRVVAPVVSGEADAEARAVRFAQELYPLLGRYLPS
jgi:EpsI family protein